MPSIPINNLTNKTDINGAELLPFVRDGKTYRCSVSGLFYNDVITTLKIASSAVTTDKIDNGAITTIKIASSAVTTDKIDNGAITTIKLANSAITTEKINNGAITTIKLASSAVTTDKIDNGAITTLKIASSAVTTDKIGDSSVTPAKLSQPLTLGTAVTTTSGTSVDFTSIPSWVKRITVILDRVSTNGNNNLYIQLGSSGGIQGAGYDSDVSTRNGDTAVTTGFILTRSSDSSSICNGIVTICNCNGNTWISSGNVSQSLTVNSSTGSKTLSATLDRIRFNGGGDTFDAGQVNIMYE